MASTDPTPTPPDSATPAPAPEPRKSASNGKRILIVEDERPLSHALEMKLKNLGFETKVVTNGQDALKELGSGSWNLILADLIMPVMDGFQLMEEMKNKKLTVPIIVLSNLGQDEDRAKAKAAGALDYFVKANTPITAIMDKVKSVL